MARHWNVPTLIAAVAIPSSLIATFAAMTYMGFTLNVITLLAPVLYSIFDDVQEWFKRRRAVRVEGEGALEEVPAV